MITQLEKKDYAVEDYFERELSSEARSEYRNGKIVSMLGGTPEHNRISGNLYIALSLSLRRKPLKPSMSINDCGFPIVLSTPILM